MTDVTTTDFSCFAVTIEDGVAHIQLKRPEAMNSMIREFWNELPVIVKDIDHNARARAIVISSTGKHFSAGMDLAVFGGGGSTSANQNQDRHINAEQQRHHILWLQDCFGCLDEARIPVIVAIQGGCIGGAVDMTSACDIRYASADAFFCIQEINIGMTADVGTFPRLCKLIPEGWVRELAYTGRRLPAHKAREIGLVNEVFDSHEALVMSTAPPMQPPWMAAITGMRRLSIRVKVDCMSPSTSNMAARPSGLWSSMVMAPPKVSSAMPALKCLPVLLMTSARAVPV